MKRLLLLLWSGMAFGQNAIYVRPAVPRIPVNGIQSVTATVVGNADKRVNWSASCGTIIGSGNTVGLKSTSIQNCNLTATMVADGTKSGTSAVHFEAVRPDLQASSTSPRIGLTPADVTSLISKIGAGNDAWNSGAQSYFTQMDAFYSNTANWCFTGGGCGAVGPSSSLIAGGWINQFTATGGGSWNGDMALYALYSLIDPTTGNRATWAAHAHDMAMWELTQECYGYPTAVGTTGACIPRNYSNTSLEFVGSQFVLNNRSQFAFVPLMQAINWNQSSFTSGEWTIIANLGHIWGPQLVGGFNVNGPNSTSGTNQQPQPVGTYSSPTLINVNAGEAEAQTNNYGLGNFNNLVALGLLLDAAHDPVDATSCATTTTTICAADGTAQKVSAYTVDAIKAFLYRLYAASEDKHIVNSALGLGDPFVCPDQNPSVNIDCTGHLSGGFPAEGTGYGGLSMSLYFPGLMNLYLAGKLDPALDPQASMISSAYWDKLATSFIAELTPNSTGSGSSLKFAYLPFGDDSESHAQGNGMMPYFGWYSSLTGDSFGTGIAKYLMYNTGFGSYTDFFYRYMGQAGLSGNFGGALFPIYIMLTTSATNDNDFNSCGSPALCPLEYDPRNASTLPQSFENLSSNGGFYRAYMRSDWTTSATQFAFMSSTPWQDHATPAAGRVDYVRKAEILMTGLDGATNNDSFAQAPSKQGTASYQYNPGFDCSRFLFVEGVCIDGGSQVSGGGNGSNTLIATSSNSSYYYGAVDHSQSHLSAFDMSSFTDSESVDLAQTEVLWAAPDLIFLYDRSHSAISSVKARFLDLQTAPTISGTSAVMTSTLGQKLFISTLLPAGATLSNVPLTPTQTDPPAITTALMTSAGTNTGTRMLHTLEGKDSGSASTTTLVQSSAGTAFDGALIGTTLCMFIRTLDTLVGGTTYPASGATTHYVTGLVPNASYAISGAGTPGSATTDSAGVLTFSASGSGNITIGAGGATGGTIVSGNSIASGHIQ